MTEKEDKIIKDFGEKENLLDEKQTKNKRIYLIISIIAFILIFVAVVIILIFTNSDKKNEESTPGEEAYDDLTQLDTIPVEELDRARKSFKQFNFTDIVNETKYILYNLFIPENYTKNEKLPLIIFISDKSLVGKELEAPLTETIGGPIWATDTVQKKHKCFVLVPQYQEGLVSTKAPKSEYLNVTIRLIRSLEIEYNIDSNRIYGTGQSMGAMTTLYLLANNPDLFAAGLIADGHWMLDELYGLVNATFTFFAAAGDPNPYNCQIEVKQYFDSQNIKYGVLDDLDAQEKVETLNNAAQKMYDLGYKQNFISYAKGTVFPPGVSGKSEHMASFKYDYRIETVRDWIFLQTKKN